MQQQRFEVFYELFPDNPVEFEVARSHHAMKGKLTRSATFMDCPEVPGLKQESFRVLLDAVQDKALHPDPYLEWWNDVMKEGEIQEEDSMNLPAVMETEEESEEEDLPMATNEQPSEPESSGSQPVSSDQPLAAKGTSPLRDLPEELAALHASAASSTPEKGQLVTTQD